MIERPTPPQPLAALVAALDDARSFGSQDALVTALAHDSRAVRPGSLFVALRGDRADGHAFVESARRAGAVAVVVDAAYAAAHPPAPGDATIVVADTRRALSRLAAAWCGEPSRALDVVGITGTNGKTTTTHLVAALLEAAGLPTGRIGTLGARFGGAMWSLANTTPLALELQSLLGEMRDRGARAVAMEVSSHALALDRVADVRFAVGALTNVTRDHLDFHGTLENYAAAKRALFAQAERAVLNADDAYGRAWADELRRAGSPAVTYGFGDGADVRAHDVRAGADGSAFTVDGTRFTLRLPGRFNVHNALAAIAIARFLDVDDATSADALAACERVPGRMEHLAAAGVDAIVDYAHTPDALDVVLRSARDAARGEVWVVFGCGGDRDRGKRPEMGRIAAQLADRVVVTSDNPRSEPPEAIARDVLAGIADRARVTLELDRRAAIRGTIAAARPGDVVVVAGKGHETYQLVGSAIHHFDDRDEVRAALAARGAEATA
jgi:UDP-N-acetylmuramoyl-L-alanyl-D-glutamate--2,6-diaminopimelate ligase